MELSRLLSLGLETRFTSLGLGLELRSRSWNLRVLVLEPSSLGPGLGPWRFGLRHS